MPPEVAQPEPVLLTVAGAEIARYHDGSELAPELSPRPYLHPVRTPAGAVLTQVHPADHHHHWGVSAAVVEVDGVMYWGGKSYVDGQGYVMLDNHGRQRGDQPEISTEGALTTLRQRLSWTGPDGAEQLTEEREIRLARADEEAHLLTWRSTLTPHRDVQIGSPATRGRTGAGYGGLFWRLGPDVGDATQVRVATAEGIVSGEQQALGAVGRWLALTQERPEGTVTLMLAQPAEDLLPWFVRTSGYVGAGPAVAWDALRPLAGGRAHDLHLWAALLDGDLDTDHADRLYRDLETLAAP